MKLRIFLALAALLVGSSRPCEGQIVANLRGDYVDGTTDGDLASFAASMGSWLYISSGTRNPTQDPVLDTMVWTDSLNRYHYDIAVDPSDFYEPTAGISPIELAADEVYFHPRNSPSPPRFAVARWTADADGNYSIAGHVRDFGVGGGDGIDFEIFVNGSSAFVSDALVNTTDTFNFSAFLSAGATVDFVIDPLGNANFDSTALAALISVPEPSTWALVGLVAVGALVQRYRAKKKPATPTGSTDRR